MTSGNIFICFYLWIVQLQLSLFPPLLSPAPPPQPQPHPRKWDHCKNGPKLLQEELELHPRSRPRGTAQPRGRGVRRQTRCLRQRLAGAWGGAGCSPVHALLAGPSEGRNLSRPPTRFTPYWGLIKHPKLKGK